MEQNVQERNVWLYGIVLRAYPKQGVSLTKAKSVPTNMREFLSWAQRQYRIDVTTSTVERETGGPTSAGACPGGCKEFSRKGSNAHSMVLFERKSATRSEKTQPATCTHQHTDHRESNAYTRKTCCVDCGTYIDSVPREIFNALEATRSASSNRSEELADRELGMTKRVRDGSMTLDDYDARSLEIARHVETGLFMNRIDHMIYNDYMCAILF